MRTERQYNLAPIRAQIMRIWAPTGDPFTEWQAYEALEGAFLGVLVHFSVIDVADRIRAYNDAQDGDEPIPNIWSMSWGPFEELRISLKMMVSDGRFSNYMGLLTAENLLIWANDNEARPDMASIVVNAPRGIEWLEWEMRGFREGLMARAAGVSINVTP